MKAARTPPHQPPDLSSLCLAITEHAPLPMATVEGASHVVRYVNPAFCRLLDKPMEQLVGIPFPELLSEKEAGLTLLDRVFRTGTPASHTEQEHSEPHPVFRSYTMWPAIADERLVGVMIQVTETAEFHEKMLAMNAALMLGSVRQHELTEAADSLNVQLQKEITERKRAEALLSCQKQALEMVAKGEPLEPVLDFLARSMESQSQDEFLVAIHLLEEDGHHFGHVAAPRLPASYAEATRGLDARLELGPCSAAVVAREPTVVRDLAAETRWPAFTAEAVSLGLRGCFSTPIFSSDQRILGTFAIYYRAPRDPSPSDQQLVEIVTRTASIAIERKQAEESLREAAERFRFMAESMPQKIFTARSNGEVDYFNQQWMKFTGLTFEQIKDWGWKQFIHPDDVEENVRRWQQCIDTGEPFEFQHRFRRADGAYRWHLSRAFPMRDAAGNITMWIGSNTDIDGQKHTENALRESETRVRALFESAEAARLSAEAAKTRAEVATRAKDDFLAALSHELRTPLNPALLLATSLADDAALPPRVRKDIDVIAKGIALQAQLVDDMLDITRITTGKLRLDLRPIDAHIAVRNAYEIVRADARERRIEVTLDLAAPHNCIKADAVRVQQIFWNVLKNAVKFTSPGGAVTVRTRNPANKKGILAVEITDTGVGIEPEMLEKIFDSFIQEEHDGAHRFGGVGLGLAITRRLVELQGGQIHAESGGHGSGATFRIELPLELPELSIEEKSARVPIAAGVPAARRILLVEDHEQTRSTLVQLLERRGHSVVGVTTAANAREIAAANDFDLVISDLGLPDGDGYALMTELRDAYGLPGIALSGYGMEEDRERSRKSGFFIHLTKPIDIHALEDAIAAAPPCVSSA